MRIGTWNILTGSPVVRDTHPSFADAIAALDVDVLGLNEVDVHQERSGFAHQAADAAAAMAAVDWRFGPSYRGLPRAHDATPGALLGPDDNPAGAHYGIALLSRIPVRRWHRYELGRSPLGLPLRSARNGNRHWYFCRDEPHLAIAAELANGWAVVATHLSFVTPVSVWQLLRLRRWAARFGPRVAIVGDMNLARACIPLRPDWRSSVNESTFPSWRPAVQLDHILLPRQVTARVLALPRSDISDHIPIAVSID